MHVLVSLTAKCNAACGHCSTSCGPRRQEHLTRAEIFALMKDMLRLAEGEPVTYALSGGEPFLDFGLLLDVVSEARRLGARSSCVTNAFWASSPEKAEALLRQLKAAGLDGIGVSSSRFHEEFVARKRVSHALDAASNIGLHCALKYVRSEGEASKDEEVVAWARGCGADRVEVIPLMSAMRTGVVLPDVEFARLPGVPEGRCPASICTVAEDGEVYTCGAPGSRHPLLRVGSIRSSTEDAWERFALGGVQQILRQQGPARFAREVVKSGSGDRLRSAYADVCDLCTHLASDPVMARIAGEAAEQFEGEFAARLLPQTCRGDS